ncbi:unnamed protein product [Pseudo-nitzschia multistriata]|uniref:Uncharacterized protein n=1 Tax=Pseudo-nitzschia multistriata TaxID=183589 RepID=A0A448ZRR2_9STRA|nr:unnamed protein product [Pseudo-nitzschia multistriata]
MNRSRSILPSSSSFYTFETISVLDRIMPKNKSRQQRVFSSDSSNISCASEKIQKRQKRRASSPALLHNTTCTRKMFCMAAATVLATSTTSMTITEAWAFNGIANNNRNKPALLYSHSNPNPLRCGPSASLYLATRKGTSPLSKTSTRLYSSFRTRKRFQKEKEHEDARKEIFGFRRALRGVARKILPTKWFGTAKEKEALERKQQVKNRVQSELDQMLKGAPLPFRMLGKLVAAPLMSKVASTVAEASYQQAETMEAILDETRSYLINDPTTVDLIGTPIQIGQPHSQRSGTTIINGKRQMRMEFTTEISGPKGSAISRVSATNEGIGQLLVEGNSRVYQVDISSKAKSSSRFGRSSSSSPPRSNGGNSSFGGTKGNTDDDNIIEAEIIEKKTNR